MRDVLIALESNKFFFGWVSLVALKGDAPSPFPTYCTDAFSVSNLGRPRFLERETERLCVHDTIFTIRWLLYTIRISEYYEHTENSSMAELLSKVNCRVIIDDSVCTFNSTIRQLSINEISICCTANKDATQTPLSHRWLERQSVHRLLTLYIWPWPYRAVSFRVRGRKYNSTQAVSAWNVKAWFLRGLSPADYDVV